MSAFHLRPVSDTTLSPSSSSPTPPPPAPQAQISPSFNNKHSSSALPAPPTSTSASMSRPRRPLSPTSLRGKHDYSLSPHLPAHRAIPDVDLPHDGDVPPRKYPVPPTGHDLMALFPPAAPETLPEVRRGPTSGYFRRQERAYFAQAGKEIVRFRVEVDLPHDQEPASNHGKSRSRDANVVRPWPNTVGTQMSPHAPNSPRPTSASSSAHFTHPNSRSQRMAPPASAVQAPSLFPVSGHLQQSALQSPPNLHSAGAPHPGLGIRTPPDDPAVLNSKADVPPDEFRDDPDESWRRPMPYNERRRAGKHTRRVIVRN